MQQDQPRRPIFIYSHPRTRSNLLAHILSTHPDISDVILYPFRAANSGGPERRIPDGSLFATKEIAIADTYQNCYLKLQQKVAEIQAQGLIPLIKDHIFNSLSTSVIDSYVPGTVNDVHPIVSEPKTVDTNLPAATPSNNLNPTVLPNSFLTNITPIIVIRHPVRMISSNVKVMFRSFGITSEDAGLRLSCTYKWSRVLFDYFLRESSGQQQTAAIVVDGDVMVEDIENRMNKLCGLIGVDGGRIRYEWAPKGSYTPMNEEMNEHVYLKDLYESTGIIREKANDPPTLEEEVEKWKVEYGEDLALKLKGFAVEAFVDYDYLMQFCVR